MTQFLEVVLRGLGTGSIYALLALGFVIIYTSTGVISFAQPALMLTGATALYWIEGRIQPQEFGSIPRAFRASRTSISIWALALRSSAAANRSTAAWTAGSRRRAKAFFCAPDIACLTGKAFRR